MRTEEFLYALLPLILIIFLFLPIPKKYFSWRFLWKPVAVLSLLFLAFITFALLTEKKSLTQKIGDQMMDVPEFKERIGRITGYGVNIRHNDIQEMPAISRMSLSGKDSSYLLEVMLDSIDGKIMLTDYRVINVKNVRQRRHRLSWANRMALKRDVRWAVLIAAIGLFVLLYTRRYFTTKLEFWKIAVMTVMLFISTRIIVQALTHEKSLSEKIEDQLLAKPELKQRIRRVRSSGLHLPGQPLPQTTRMTLSTKDSSYQFEVTLDSIDGDIKLTDYVLKNITYRVPRKD